MKRISANDVVDAFIATGRCRSPSRYLEGECGACALGVLYVFQGHKAKNFIDYEDIADSLGLDREYCADFSNGFESDDLFKDGGGKVGVVRPNSIGYQDGLAAQRAVTAHFARATSPTEPTCATEPIAVGR